MPNTKLQWKAVVFRTHDNKLNNAWSSYAGGNFCGPGWGFTKQDVEAGRIAQLPQAIDAIDRACARHDQCYEDNGYFTKKCNVRLATELTVIIVGMSSTPQQRVDAAVMAAIFATEAMLIDDAAKTGQTFVQLSQEAYRRLADYYTAQINRGVTYLRVIEQGFLQYHSTMSFQSW